MASIFDILGGVMSGGSRGGSSLGSSLGGTLDPSWIPFQARPNRPRIHLITILPKKVAWEACLAPAR